jgi:hypothetical protein
MATNITIGGRSFNCVKLSEADFTNVMAVYVILCMKQDGSWSVLDVGQRGQVRSWIDDHDRKARWTSSCPNNIWVGICLMPSCQYTNPDCERFEAELRKQYCLP